MSDEAPGPGHNSGAPAPAGNAGGIAADRLKSFIERIERLEEEKAAISGDIKEVYSEAKSAGYDTKIMRQMVRERKMSKEDFQEQEQLREVYRQALGMFAGTELGKATMDRVTGAAGA